MLTTRPPTLSCSVVTMRLCYKVNTGQGEGLGIQNFCRQFCVSTLEQLLRNPLMRCATPPHFALPVPVWLDSRFMVGGLGVEDQHSGSHEVRVLLLVIYVIQFAPKMKPANENQDLPLGTVRPLYRTGTPLPSKHPILYMFSTNIRTEFF